MTDIDLYTQTTALYETLQQKRPDYVGARKALLELALKFLKDKAPLTIADFCCGTGNNTHLIADRIALHQATLIDINKEFLEIAAKSNIRAESVVPIQSDILKVSLRSEHDAIISMFAYHHVPDEDKEKYIEVSKDALKIGGVLLLGEIYSPDKATTLAYYDYLLKNIPQNSKSSELEKFIMQTANSDRFEYKVSREFTHQQLISAGFVLRDGIKVWPLATDTTFPEDVGTFVEVWELVKR